MQPSPIVLVQVTPTIESRCETSISSWPCVKSVIWVKAQGTSFQVKWSAPAPPVMVSWPWPPIRVSSPEPPTRLEPPSWPCRVWPPLDGGGGGEGGGG